MALFLLGVTDEALLRGLGQGSKAVAVSGVITLDDDGVAALAAGSVSAAKLADAVADALWSVEVTAAAEADDKRVLSVQVKDIQSNNVAAATRLVFKPVTAVDASYAVSDEGAGTGLTSSADKVSTLLTDATGLAQIGITDTAAQTIALAFETPRGPVHVELAFA